MVTNGRYTVDSLNGLRGLAILAVLLLHTGVPGFRLGGLGVDLFFVLSGFLITTMLCREWQTTSRLNLPAFWTRRFLRLMPVYWVFVGSMTLWMWFGSSETGMADGWGPKGLTMSMWFYFLNYLPGRGIWDKQEIVSPLWSLAVEEQFYLLWPPLMLIATRVRRSSYLVGAMLLVIVVVRRQYVEGTRALLFRLDTRGLAIVMGCTVALWFAQSSATAFGRRLVLQLRIGVWCSCLMVTAAGDGLVVSSPQ